MSRRALKSANVVLLDDIDRTLHGFLLKKTVYMIYGCIETFTSEFNNFRIHRIIIAAHAHTHDIHTLMSCKHVYRAYEDTERRVLLLALLKNMRSNHLFLHAVVPDEEKFCCLHFAGTFLRLCRLCNYLLRPPLHGCK
jgi:hypothetical protein